MTIEALIHRISAINAALSAYQIWKNLASKDPTSPEATNAWNELCLSAQRCGINHTLPPAQLKAQLDQLHHDVEQDLQELQAAQELQALKKKSSSKGFSR